MTSVDFNNLVVRHGEFLRPYAITLTKNHEDAKDLFQETVLRALLNKEKYQFGTNLKGWLYTIMRNIFINNYRRSKKFVKVSGEVQGNEMYEIPGESTSYNNAWSNMRLGEIKKAIDDLPQIFRLSFELYYIGYKYHEIAVLLREPLGTIKSRIHFARKILISELER